jgi:hypothetical protein
MKDRHLEPLRRMFERARQETGTAAFVEALEAAVQNYIDWITWEKMNYFAPAARVPQSSTTRLGGMLDRAKMEWRDMRLGRNRLNASIFRVIEGNAEGPLAILALLILVALALLLPSAVNLPWEGMV